MEKKTEKQENGERIIMEQAPEDTSTYFDNGAKGINDTIEPANNTKDLKGDE